jgi:hypothetical protein
MADLSPAAQAVLDAAFPAYDDETLYVATGEQHAGKIAAAALRAAADQPYEVPAYYRGDDYWRFRDGVDAERNRLLDIATELDNVSSANETN